MNTQATFNCPTANVANAPMPTPKHRLTPPRDRREYVEQAERIVARLERLKARVDGFLATTA